MPPPLVNLSREIRGHYEPPKPPVEQRPAPVVPYQLVCRIELRPPVDADERTAA